MAGSRSKQDVVDKIEGFINEENKIVTYKWLSRTLCVDVDTAKHYLYCFIEESKSKYPINVCYLLGGIQEKADNTKVHKIVLTSEDKLEDSKLLFSSLTSFHVYSIQFSKIKDSSALYTAEVVSKKKFEDEQKYSAVKYDKVEIIRKGKPCETRPSNETFTSSKDQKQPIKSSQPAPKQKKNELFSLWKKHQSNTEKLEKKETGAGLLKSSLTISNAEEKENSTSTKQVSTCRENNVPKKPPSKSEGVKIIVPSIKRGQGKCKEKTSSRLTLKQRRKHDVEHVLSSDNEAEKQVKKKHKRIVQISESESESEEESSDEEFISQSKKLRICVESEEEEEEKKNLNELEESPFPQSQNSTVSYKTVNKTYMDENGFMVTKKIKECVIESPKNEEKSPVGEKPNSSPVTPIENNSNPIQKKQASLMNFFTRK